MRTAGQILVLSGGDVATAMIAFPKGSDIRPSIGLFSGFPGNGDVVECPAGSGRFYQVFMVEDVAKGFTNEYRVGVCKVLGYTGVYPIT